MTEIHCAVCGKEIDTTGKPEKLVAWMEHNPDKCKCEECFGKAVKAGAKPTASKGEVAKKASTFNSKAKAPISADDLRKAYDEVKAAFSDVFDEVAPFIGGWTTTIALSKK